MLAPDADNVASVDDGPMAPMTTSCSTRTTSPATAAATRTSASPPSTLSSTPSTTAGRPDQDVVLSTNDPAFLSQWLVDGTAPATFPTSAEEIERAAMERRTPVPGGPVRHRDAVSAPGVRGFCAPHPARHRRVRGYHADIDPAIVAEFAHTVYRFGHSMLTETVARTNADGTIRTTSGLIDAFLNPLAFAAGGPTQAEAAGAIVRGMTNQVGNEIDDLSPRLAQQSAWPAARPCRPSTSRAAAIPASHHLNSARGSSSQDTGDAALEPYDNWADFGQGIKHPEVPDQFHCRLRQPIRPSPPPRLWRRSARPPRRSCSAGDGAPRRPRGFLE